MTVPMWSPFALLIAVCAFCPPPAWTRRIDWARVTVLVVGLSLCVGFWVAVIRVLEWAA